MELQRVCSVMIVLGAWTIASAQQTAASSQPTAAKEDASTAPQASVETMDLGNADAGDAVSSEKEPGIFGLWPRTPESGAISTDRPGFADATSVLPPGYFQLELGYMFTSDEEDGAETRNHLLPQVNFRAGIIDNLELRLLWSGYSATESEFDGVSRGGRHVRVTDHDDGVTDLTIGARTRILENDGFVPDLTFLANVTMPTGSDSKSAGDVVPDMRLAYGWSLTDRLRLYGVGIAAAATGDDGRFFQASGSAGLSYAWTDRIGTFVEYYGIYPNSRDSDCAHTANGGVVFLIDENTQIDFSAGVGLNEEAADYFVGCGLSFRF